MDRARVALAGFALAAWVGGPGAAELPRGRAPAFDAPLAAAPLDTPLVVTGGFGEYRVGHFHAGFDFGTGQRVGRPVKAPLPGFIERVRASGVGYGRSVYLRTTDGRLLQFGHLDAFAPALAAYVDSVQRATGQYEQDLYPPVGRFRVRAGDRIAWTGQSGAGGPHMHFEIRRGDVAFHPERAGLRVRDGKAPSLVSLTLEPLDDASTVAGSLFPVTVALGATPETLRVTGRVRAVVGARDGVWSGVDRMVPWSTRIEWDDQWVECRMDSISWATEMSEGDYVFDAGRVTGDKGIVLWAPAGWRPRFILSSAPPGQEAGTIVVRAGDTPRTLRVSARDVSGNRAERTVVVAAGTATSARAKAAAPRLGWTALPGGWVRTGGTSGRGPAEGGFGPGIRRPADAFAKTNPDSAGLAHVRFGRPETFDGASVAFQPLDLPRAAAELIPVRGLAWVGPETTPLRRAMAIEVAKAGLADTAHVGLYRWTTDEWEWVRMTPRPDGRAWDADSRSLGQFALFADTLAPRVTPRTPPRKAPKGPYSRWAFEAAIAEHGSGVDARASYFTVDGERVPVEWDPEADVLRWRPLRRPAKGTHRVSIVAADRAGNARIRSATFVLD